MCNEYHASPVLSICIAFDKLVEIPYASREAMHCAVSARSQRWELRLSTYAYSKMRGKERKPLMWLPVVDGNVPLCPSALCLCPSQSVIMTMDCRCNSIYLYIHISSSSSGRLKSIATAKRSLATTCQLKLGHRSAILSTTTGRLRTLCRLL